MQLQRSYIMAEITLSPEQVNTAQAGTMKRHFDILQAMGRTDPLITEALALLDGTDHDGRLMALTAIKWTLKDYRPAAPKNGTVIHVAHWPSKR
jgi:ribulose 1,5-bisphosphate synthetase/thiazole synthase